MAVETYNAGSRRSASLPLDPASRAKKDAIRTCAGRDALPRDSAWHVSTLPLFGSSDRPRLELVLVIDL
jgi:hypothetical protein